MADIKVTDVREKAGDAAFLIDNGTTSIMYDSGFAFTGYKVADRIKSILGKRQLDYIFLTHSHYDHALGSVYAKRYYPDTKVVAGEYAAKIFAKPSAKALMRELDKKFAKKCGVYEYEDLIDELSVDIPVCDGDIIKAGELEFKVISLPGHTKCSVGFYESGLKLLLGCETLGVFNGKDDIVPSYLVGYKTTMNSIERVLGLDIESIVVPHYGLITGDTAKLYLKKSYETTKKTTEDFVALMKEGKSNADILQVFKDRFYHGEIINAYPIDAMTLNVGIMTDLIRREFDIQ
ncbi:MAG: MBL fold metallo-hydrolase [Ruminococcaceae bacterium]|nr:MBL fold metallo-hydrolase [Oscillospiraceae bacterium]